MRNPQGLRPQDVLILLKLISIGDQQLRQIDLAMDLGVSQSEIVHSLARLRNSGLIDDSKRKPFRLAALEFLIHAVKYIFPVEIGSFSRGIPTAHSAKPLSKEIVSSEGDQYVWPSEDGEVRGLSVKPIYETVPMAVKRDPKLYELLALMDAVRLGRAREKNLAEHELRKRILKASA